MGLHTPLVRGMTLEAASSSLIPTLTGYEKYKKKQWASHNLIAAWLPRRQDNLA